MIKKFIFFLMCLFALNVYAEDTEINPYDSKTTEEILNEYQNAKPTNCAGKIFSQALIDKSNEINEMDEEDKVRAWAQITMQSEEVLEQILQCPEITSIKEDTTIIFNPIVYTFPNGREITINYSTQPKVLKHHLMLARKRSLLNGDNSPKLGDPNDPAKYINTDPAWYGILVVQHGALDNFVGEEANNTVSIKYINDHIDSIYPQGYYCTSRSAWANDKDTINQVVKETVDIEKDSNDYYVAGDINLEWVMYAEIAADVILTVVTMGGGQIATASLKGARASKTAIKLSKNAAKMKRFEHVAKYAKDVDKISSVSKQIEVNSKNIKNASKYQKALKDIEKARQTGKDVATYEKRAQKILEEAQIIDPWMTPDKLRDAEKLQSETEALAKQLPDLEKQLAETLKENQKLLSDKKKLLSQAKKNTDPKKIKEYEKLQLELDKLRDSKNYDAFSKTTKDPKLAKQIQDIEKKLKDMEQADDFREYAKLHNEVQDLETVDDYAKTANALKDIREYQKNLYGWHRPQTGNVFTRSLKKVGSIRKSLKAINGGAKTMNKAGRVARAGMSSKSAKLGHWLMDSTLKHGARLAKFERNAGALYGVLVFLGDMYDKTSTTSQEYSNGIEFKPFCLLSADDIEGQDNVVNYGMWLMWVGNSTDPADDDAAYLQSMDFAGKFFYNLDSFQEEHGVNCNVDIYVVRPIIRLDESDSANPSGEMFYLIMNEIPWSTNKQFKEKVGNIEDWERTQKSLAESDPENKSRKHDKENTEQESESSAPETTE